MLKDMDFHVAAFHAPFRAFQAPSGGAGIVPTFRESSVGTAAAAEPARFPAAATVTAIPAPSVSVAQASAMDVDTDGYGPPKKITEMVTRAGEEGRASAEIGAAAAGTAGSVQRQQQPFVAKPQTPQVAAAAAAGVLLECPVCGQQVGGGAAGEGASGHTSAQDAELMLQRHVEGHFQEAARQQTAPVAGGGHGVGPLPGIRRPILVECPICGDGFHSERDVSRHMDEVH